MNKIESFAKCIIKNYNFSSHLISGFSCYIPDKNKYGDNGFIIWVYSNNHNRFETQFEKLFSSNRINLIKEFNVKKDDYINMMYNALIEFISELDSISGMQKIGKGINNAPKKIFNRAITFDSIIRNYQILKEIEITFTNNSLIDFICLLKKNTKTPFLNVKNINPTCYSRTFNVKH